MSVWNIIPGYGRVLILLGTLYAIILICRFIGFIIEGKVEDYYHSKIKWDMESMKRRITEIEHKAGV